jgi:hypothetical protein
MADNGSEVPAQTQSIRKKGKAGISVQDLGYNVIFTGGERTLEKNPEQTIDLQRFEQEVDPMFKDRTQKFDSGMLLNTLVVGKGLNILLDSDIAEISRKVLDESISRLPKKGTPQNLLDEERDRDTKK